MQENRSPGNSSRRKAENSVRTWLSCRDSRPPGADRCRVLRATVPPDGRARRCADPHSCAHRTSPPVCVSVRSRATSTTRMLLGLIIESPQSCHPSATGLGSALRLRVLCGDPGSPIFRAASPYSYLRARYFYNSSSSSFASQAAYSAVRIPRRTGSKILGNHLRRSGPGSGLFQQSHQHLRLQCGDFQRIIHISRLYFQILTG